MNNNLQKMEFLKYNSIKIRHNIKTDFYTEQTVEKIKYNFDSLIKNTVEKYKEVMKND